MKTNNNTRYHKKIPYYLLLAFLTSGAGLILGFLSFSGMYVLFPMLPVAFGAFALSVAYEGEIYLQNIKGSLNKLFKYNYLENYIAKEYLLNNFPENDDCPQFFQDYKAQLQLLEPFAHKTLDKESTARKQQIENTLKDMEKWFALQLFADENSSKKKSEYQNELATWLAKHDQSQWQNKLAQRKSTFYKLRIFSAFAGMFMTLGTTYLIVEAFSVIPYFMAIPFSVWPFLIVPMALIAGTAYGMLTYNAATDFVNNDTVRSWYHKFQNDWKKGATFHNVVMGTVAVFLVTITVALTICTAGTWWTVANNARPLFDWMKKMPRFIMGVINPIITGLSAVCFNFQNTAESMEMVDNAMKSKGFWHQLAESVLKGWKRVRKNENTLQMLNPFRLVLKLTILPLRVIFFLGHLVSIGVTANRMPGVSEKLAALIAIISEGFEDAHYFVGHDHAHYEEAEEEECEHHEHSHAHSLKAMLTERLSAAHSHNHDVDIPTKLIKTFALPVYFLAATWDYGMSQMNKRNKILSFKQAWNKQRGVETGEHVHVASSAQKPSDNWRVEHTISLIEKHQRKHLGKVMFNRELADEKVKELDKVKVKVHGDAALTQTLEDAKNEPVFGRHRMFSQGYKTSTQEFVEELSVRVLV